MNIFELVPKFVSETRACEADFIGELSSGVTISSATVIGPLYSGGPSSLTIGSPVITGSKVRAAVSAGTAGALHQLIFAATLSDGQIIRLTSFLAIAPDTL